MKSPISTSLAAAAAAATLSYFIFVSVSEVGAQQIGQWVPEIHPKFTVSACRSVLAPSNISSDHNECIEEDLSLVLDANWRWTHQVNDYTSCFTANKWNKEVCSDPVSCAKNCALEGAEYEKAYGIKSSGSSLNVRFAEEGTRLFLLNGTSSMYKLFKLKNKEISFDVDVSQLPCGLNGALYFVEMDEDGGSDKYPNNRAGATYGKKVVCCLRHEL
jgi:cellulose 1,4-beta-cellobiosidase